MAGRQPRIAAVVALLVLAGCGGGQGGDEPDSEAGSRKEVEGEPADHYRGVADVKTLRKTVPELAISGNPNERVPVEIWLADGRPRRLLIDFDTHSVVMRYDAVVLGFDAEEIPGPPPARATIEAGEQG